MTQGHRHPFPTTEQVIQVFEMMFFVGLRLTGETLLSFEDVAHTYSELLAHNEFLLSNCRPSP
jgi:hypothetical protein